MCVPLLSLGQAAFALASLSPFLGQVQETTKEVATPMRLPVIAGCQPAADAREADAVLTVLWDGRILSGDEVLLDPAKDEARDGLREWISKQAGGMEKRKLAAHPEFGELPDGLLLLRCDASAGMEHLLGILMDCASSDPPLWRVHMAALYVKDPGEKGVLLAGQVNISLLHEEQAEPPAAGGGGTEADGPAEETEEPCEVVVKVREPGKKLVAPKGQAYDEEAGGHFYFDRSTRLMWYSCGPRRVSQASELGETLGSLARAAKSSKSKLPPLIISAGPETIVEDAALVIEQGLEHGFKTLGFTEAR